jgi:hypothetical protein
MHIYSLHCFDQLDSTVFRHTFEAEHNSEARLIAGAICDACSDEHHRFQLWKDDLPLADGKTLGALLDDGGLSPRAQQTVRLALIALLNSDWRVSHSRKLRGKVGAWAAEAGDAVPHFAWRVRKCAGFIAASRMKCSRRMACAGPGPPIWEMRTERRWPDRFTATNPTRSGFAWRP